MNENPRTVNENPRTVNENPRTVNEDLRDSLLRAAEAIAAADGIVVAAGAGMGVDSGLPDFRGKEGFWQAYPPFRERNLSFQDLANPIWFRAAPEQAWGFYGHRLHLYRQTIPHDGFQLLRSWGEGKPAGYFVFTSNVDGQFQKAGYDPQRIVECHGTIHYLQCSRPCCPEIWSADSLQLTVDETTFRAEPPLPVCPRCDAVARPNILLFGDGQWVEERSNRQAERYARWLAEHEHQRLVVVECGAGTAVPTVRWEAERLKHALVRINLHAPDVPRWGIGIPSPALSALRDLAELLEPSTAP